MRILFITDNFPPEVNAPATRTYEHCKEWVSKGISVTVLTCFPNYPQGVVYNGYKNKFYEIEYIDGIRVIRLWSFIAKNEGFVKRTIDYLSFSLTSFIGGLFVKSDIIVATSPQFFTTLSGAMLSFIKRKPWVFELRDLWPESIIAVNAIQNKRIISFLSKLELFLYRNADLVIPVTEAFKERLIKRNINPKKIHVITNGANLKLFKAKEKSSELIEKLSLQEKFVIGYIGTHGLAHSLDFIVNSISKIKNENIHFLFIGDGAQKGKIIQLAKHHQLKNCTFLPPILKEEVPTYLSIIDYSLVPLAKRETFKTVIPSKIFESASMLKPILLGVEGQAKEIIDKYKAGVCFDPENEEDFIKKIEFIAANPIVYDDFKMGCRQLSMDYDRTRLASDMLKVLKIVVNI